MYIVCAVLACAAAGLVFAFVRPIGIAHAAVAVLAVALIAIAAYASIELKAKITGPLAAIAKTLNGLFNGRPDPAFTIKGAQGEFAELSELVRNVSGRMHSDIEMLGKIRNGDYSFDFGNVHEGDGLLYALQGMLDRQRGLVQGLKAVSEQITSASGEIASGSQSLASGSNEQAAAIEQFRATVELLRVKAGENADKAREVIDAIGSYAMIVDGIGNDMATMTKTMYDINESAKRISKVSDVIESIAFQTNILALNAAVEAARAGQQGRGFAVVADEVRELSNKSAEAARETAELIRADLANVEIGNRLAESAAASIGNVSRITNDNQARMAELSESSISQSAAINEISVGINQIAVIIQSNAALAEESAAASAELSSQAFELDKLVEFHKIKS
jgi:methyl-accepting chemotaxis protein